jgi:HEAT repeat protein
MLKFVLFLLLPIFCDASVENVSRRVQAHLLIGDTKCAVQEARQAFQTFPDDPQVYEWLIKSLAAAGEDTEMMSIWEKMAERFKERSQAQDLIEEMCWGILDKGKKAPGLSSQLICMIGAALGQDMKAIPFLKHGLDHSNAILRAVAVELSAHYGDQPLREKLSYMFHHETVLDVRLSVIKAIGTLQMEEHLPALIHCVANPKKGPREKLAAIEAIILMRDKLDQCELEGLGHSQRAGLRELACEVIAHCELKNETHLLLTLMQDPQPEVCAAAIRTWSLLRCPVTEGIKSLALSSLDPEVGVTAAWSWMLEDPENGGEAMMKWLESDHPHVRALAASAVAKTGSYGVALAKRLITESQDPYVRVNLAIGLAGQREACDQVCITLEECLQNNHDKWMFSEKGIFKTLEKSDLEHNPAIANYPEVMNQTVRLELLNLLAILESPRALDAIKLFLKERKWGVTGLAAETLLGEGDETAIELVRDLLKDPDRHIRVEAALVLASWGKDNSALPTLLEVYPKSDRQMQLKILESLGRIGDHQAIPFLLERLKEPSLMIRMVAASVLIQTLNH